MYIRFLIPYSEWNEKNLYRFSYDAFVFYAFSLKPFFVSKIVELNTSVTNEVCNCWTVLRQGYFSKCPTSFWENREKPIFNNHAVGNVYIFYSSSKLLTVPKVVVTFLSSFFLRGKTSLWPKQVWLRQIGCILY